MSRRRSSWAATPPLTTEQLLTERFGERFRHPRAPMPGCCAPCCAPAREPERRSVAWEQAMGWAVLAVSLVVGLWRMVG